MPRDSAACSVGADEVAAELSRLAGDRIRLVRNGSRGMLWLEPLVEVVTTDGRVGYGPVQPGDVAGLVEAGLLDGAEHPLRLGRTDELDWLRSQHRVTFARVGVTDPLSSEDYLAHGGLVGLRRALELTPEQVVEELVASGLRGRGGAGFPAGLKWRTVMLAQADQKYICCNADEGDSGTFADRMLIEGDPFALIEGMLIAARAVGRHRGLRLPPLGVPRGRRDAADGDRDRLRPGLAGRERARLRPRLRPARAARRRRLHLR